MYLPVRLSLLKIMQEPNIKKKKESERERGLNRVNLMVMPPGSKLKSISPSLQASCYRPELTCFIQLPLDQCICRMPIISRSAPILDAQRSCLTFSERCFPTTHLRLLWLVKRAVILWTLLLWKERRQRFTVQRCEMEVTVQQYCPSHLR